MREVRAATYLEVRAARGQNDFVRVNLVVLGQQRNVDELVVLQQRRKHRHHIWLVIIPSQTKLPTAGHFYLRDSRAKELEPRG